MSNAILDTPPRPQASAGHAKSAAVVGSGFGGLAAAIRMQAAGIKTVIYEARDKPGGRAYVYEDDGFTFDAGPTVITAPHCLEDLFEVSQRTMSDYVKLLPVTPFYRLHWQDGTQFDYVGNEKELLQQIAKINPKDVDGYRKFADYTRKVFEKGYVELADVPFLRFWDMVKVAPSLARLRADRGVYQTVSRFIRDERLRQAFSFHPLLVGGNPFDTSSIYTLIHWIEREWGVFFPEGGTGALVQGLVRLFCDLGGEIRLSEPVNSIEVRKINGEDRHFVNDNPTGFHAVISNADLHHTYSKLYRSHSSAKRTANRLAKMDWSMSLFVMYFGTNRRYSDVAHHTILFGDRFRGLLDDIFRGDKLAEDFSLYLHAPTVTDESLAPPGCEAFYVLSPVPHLGRVDMDWDQFAQTYGDRILKSLESYLPGVSDSVVTMRHFTPKDFQLHLNAFHGSAFSVAPKLTQSAYFRPHNRDKSIPGLYIVGAGTHPGAGVPGVINSAKATTDLVLKDLGVAAR